MSNIIRFPSARRQSVATLRATWLAGGTINAYTGPKTIDGDTALTTQTLLAVYHLPDPIGTVVDGVLTAGPIAPGINLATGTVAFCRAYDRDGVPAGDYDAGSVGSGEAVEFDVLSLTVGSLSAPTSFVVMEG